MLKNYVKSQGITIKSLSEKTGIPYSTLNDIMNGKTDIDRVAFGTVKKLASALKLTLDELAGMCCAPFRSGDVDYDIIIKNKRYYLRYMGQEIYLFKVNKLNSDYVTFAADTYIDTMRKEKETEDKWTDYIS